MFSKGFRAALAASLASHAQGAVFDSSFGVPGDKVTYDHLIGGGGNASLTIAARLVE